MTRAEREILEDRAASIAAQAQGLRTLAELGSGSAVKTRLLIDAFAARSARLRYVPIDISRSALEASARPLLAAHPELEVRAVSGEYAEGIALLPQLCEPPTLLLWLGSNVGNLSREEARAFLARLHQQLSAGDRVLLGVDLRKDASVLEKAYDDAQGVTARFNKNLLDRINHELGGEFDLDAFAHRARYEVEAGRVVMELVSLRRQRVRLEGLDLTLDFAPDEAIHTESSYKYSPEEIDTLAAGAGFRTQARWLDSGARFALNLLAWPAASAGA